MEGSGSRVSIYRHTPPSPSASISCCDCSPASPPLRLTWSSVVPQTKVGTIAEAAGRRCRCFLERHTNVNLLRTGFRIPRTSFWLKVEVT